MKRLTLLFCSILLCCLASQATVIKGKVSINNQAIVSVTCSTDTASLTLQSDAKDYSLTLSPKVADIATLYVVYKDAEGANRQMYTPLCVDPSIGEIVIDIKETGNNMLLTSADADTKAFIEYATFLQGQFKANPELEDADNYLQSFNYKAQQLASATKHPLSSRYITLWGENSRSMAAMMLKHRYGNKIDSEKDSLWTLPPSAESLIDNPATKYFPEFISIVASATTQGSNLRQRIASLHQNVHDADLAEIIERRLIQQFVKRKGEKGKSVEYNLAMLDSVASHRPEYAEWREKLSDIQSYTKAGDPAPDDILLDPQGKEHRLSDYKGKYIFIDLWASWCVYCIREFPALHEIEKEFASDDIVFISLSLDSTNDAWQSALKRLKLEGNQLLVSSTAFAEKLGISSIPRYLIYDKQGRLIDGNAPRPSETAKITALLRSLK